MELTGFKTLTLTDVIVEPDRLIAMKLILEPSGEYEMVGIVAATALFDTPVGTTIISDDIIRRLPIE